MKETFVAESIWQRVSNLRSGHDPQNSGMVLALVLRTEASTYQKSGAVAVLDGSRVVAGMVSGGCLEADLAHRVAQFLEREAGGPPAVEGSAVHRSLYWSYVRYDTRRQGDDILGTALGCRGALDIALLRMDDPGLADFFRSAWSSRSGMAGLCSVDSAMGLALTTVDQSGSMTASVLRLELSKRVDVPLVCLQELMAGLSHPLVVPKRRRVLLCGCGLDAIPLLGMFVELGFELTLVDHRPDDLERAHSRALRFVDEGSVTNHCQFVTAVAAQRLVSGAHPVSGYDAVIIMSHHVEWDGRYLDAVRTLDPKCCYIGLLGPPGRRQEVFALLAQDHPLDVQQLHSPMGLRFGTRGPTAVAIGVVAELLQYLG